MENKIIPSTKLRCVTVHKLRAATCPRYYFWERVLNLEFRKPNLNFWYGGVLGAGYQALLLGKSMIAAKKLMAKESKRRLFGYTLSSDDAFTVQVGKQLIELFIEAAYRQCRPDFNFKKMHLDQSELKVSFPLDYSDVTYCGTLDGLGTYGGRPAMYEIKTARIVNNDYLSTLAFDSQIHSYALGCKKTKSGCPSKCIYTIFRKTGKKIKRGQSVDGFINEIRADLANPIEAKKLLIMHPQTLGTQTLVQTREDMEANAWQLSLMYENMDEEQLLDPVNWGRQTTQCLHYGACPFLILCKNLRAWKVMLPMFQQREMLYELEKEELQ